MAIRIVHISDTHGYRGQESLNIPECDLLVHTGDIGGRTNLAELTEFLIWFEQQPAHKKIFIAGNHDIILSKQAYLDCRNPKYTRSDYIKDSVAQMLMKQAHEDAMALIEKYDVKYLCEKEYVYEGLKIYGFPHTPSFHRMNGWAFNADRGQEMQTKLGKIPSDVNILLAHGPVYGVLDVIPDSYLEIEENNEVHRGCKDMLAVIKKRLHSLKLYCCGHIHSQYGVVLAPVSNTRNVLFSNGAVIDNDYKLLITSPLIITI